jgi:hypothetical protein
MDLITEEKNPLLFWKSLKITDTVYSISTVWRGVKSETIKRSFQKILPDNLFDCWR